MKTIQTLLIAIVLLSTVHATDQIKIGTESRLPDNPRSHYNRYVNWRPANGETVHLNPPRISWPYVPNGNLDWYSASHIFTLQISSKPDLSNPTVDITSSFNFYNFLPKLKDTDTWYWRVGYDVGTKKETWSPIRSFTIAKDATSWDRSNLANEPLKQMDHPRILFNSNNLTKIQQLAKTHPGSRAALDKMKEDADNILQKSWWNNFPKTDRDKEPEQQFYTIAHDLALVCFVWRITDDPKYTKVKDHALTWASYPPGGRASPEGLGGDSNEDATQGNEFLALLFDWLYTDLTENQRNIMIHSLEWRIDHWMNTFAWHARNRKNIGDDEIHYSSLGSIISSHQYEGSMDTAVCALALYEHSPVARQWYDLILSYMIGISSGHGFDGAWNEGPGYGSSKFKWFMNASMYFDTTLPNANLGKNPFYQTVGDWLCRVIPMGMNHNAWGNQNNASKGNHRATMRKLAHLTGQGRFLLNWHEYGGKDYARFRPWIEYVLPAYYQTPNPTPEEDPIALFPIDGWAMAASGPPSLSETYAQGTGLIFQSRPRGGFSHSFNSDNSFQLHAFGQMLNHGGGSSGNGDAYAYHTMSHNTILVDGLGQAQPSRGQIHPTYSQITGFSRGDNYVYMAGNATNAYPKEPGDYSRWSLPLHKVYQQHALPHLKHFVRHILYVNNRYFVIFDDLSSTKPATYTWLYHILPDNPIVFDPKTFRIDYTVGDTHVRLQHLAYPKSLTLDNRKGEDGFTNPFTGEDYRQYRKGNILAGHNLWISNREPASNWQFLTVIYPTKPDEAIPEIQHIDNATVRIGEEIISFDPKSPSANEAAFVIDPTAMQ